MYGNNIQPQTEQQWITKQYIPYPNKMNMLLTHDDVGMALDESPLEYPLEVMPELYTGLAVGYDIEVIISNIQDNTCVLNRVDIPAAANELHLFITDVLQWMPDITTLCYFIMVEKYHIVNVVLVDNNTVSIELAR